MLEIKAYQLDGKLIKKGKFSTLPVVVGRSHEETDFQVPDSSLSSRHCVIEEKDGNISVRDFASKNGLMYREQKSEEFVIEDRDDFYAGRIQFKVRIDRSSEGGTEIVDMHALLKSQKKTESRLLHPIILPAVSFLLLLLGNIISMKIEPRTFEVKEALKEAVGLFLLLGVISGSVSLVQKVVNHRHYFRQLVFNLMLLLIAVQVYGLFDHLVLGYVDSYTIKDSVSRFIRFSIWFSFLYLITTQMARRTKKFSAIVALIIIVSFVGIKEALNFSDYQYAKKPESREVLYPLFDHQPLESPGVFEGAITEMIADADKDLANRLEEFDK